MSRTKSFTKREILPDYKYNDIQVSKLIRYIMRNGELSLASNIVYKALEEVENKVNNKSKDSTFNITEKKRESLNNIEEDSSDNFESQNFKSGSILLEEALDKIRPKVQLKRRRMGSVNLSIPMEISKLRSNVFALRWIVLGVRERLLKNAIKDLAKILFDSINNTGFAVNKKNDMHKQAESNKVFANYRW